VPASLFLTILFPIVLTVAFGLAFGGGSTGIDSTYNVGIVDLDESRWSEYFIGNISINDVFVNISYGDSQLGQNDLAQGKISALIIIPSDFGASIESFWANPGNPNIWINTTVELFVDQGSLVASNAIPPLFQQILLTTIYGEFETAPQSVQIGNPAEIMSEHLTTFDLMVPGLYAFAAIFSILIVAEGFVDQRSSGLLRRIQLTPTSSTEVIVSSFISNMITAVLQVAILFGTTLIMGFTPQTDIVGVFFAFILVILLTLCSVGFGLIAASIAKNPGGATGISFIFILPQMFFGTFVPGSSDIGQLVPSYYVTDALTSILLRGAAITSDTIIYDLIVMIGFAIIVIILGIAIFAKFGREK
jgi:ABC-2 type transport system permease protein